MNKSELVKALQTRAKDTPYMIEETEKGFKLLLNIVDKKWYTILQKNGLKKTFNIEGKVNERSKVVNTTDTMRTIKWRAGGLQPTLSGQIRVEKGELWDIGFRKDLGVSEEGKAGKVFDYTYSTPEAKKWLTEGLKENDFKRALGTEAKIGLFFVIFAVVGGVIPVLILLLTGNLS